MEPQIVPYELHDMCSQSDDEFSSLELMAIIPFGVVVASLLISGAAAASVAYGVNEIVQQSRRVFYLLRGKKLERVDDEDNFFPYYRTIGQTSSFLK